MHLETVFDGFDVEIDWLLTQRCNYSCSYCGSYDNSQEVLFKSLEDYEEAFSFVKSHFGNYRGRISLLGGEPTLYKKWVELVNILDKLNFKLKITTNLAVPVEKYVNRLNKSLGKFIIGSFHAEFSDPDNFIKNVRKLNKEGFLLGTSIMALPSHWDVVKYTYSKLKDVANLDMIYSENSTSVQLAEDYIDYTDTQLNLIKQSNMNQGDYKLFLDKNEYDLKKLKHEHGVNFKGWKCKVGQKKIHITPNGDVYPSACLLNYRRAKMGNIYKKEMIKPVNPIDCPFTMCPCGSDIRIEKWAQV